MASNGWSARLYWHWILYNTIASTSFCSRSRYHRRMNRGDSVPVAICTTSTPMMSTNPSRPTIAPTSTLSTLVAVAAE